MRKRMMAAIVTLLACVVIYFSYGELSILRGTFFWDLRYVVFTVFLFLVLTLAEKLENFITSGRK